MMSLAKPSFLQVVKKQYSLKLKSYNQVFITLVIFQILAILFSFGGIGGSGTSSDRIDMDIHYYSADHVVILTILWGFITAIIITTKAYRNDDITFVTNRLSSNLSNVLFLLTASFIGGITAMLSPSLLKIIMYYAVGQHYVDYSSEWIAFPIGIFSTSFYIFLTCALGYFSGILIQIHKVFALLLPALFFGMLIGEGSGKLKILIAVYEFLFSESSFLLFISKSILIAVLLFTISFVVSNRMEVRQ
jgi:hypothetical protein